MADTHETSVAFDVDAALLVELGERLVTRRSVALAELIKNSYDADATQVHVEFRDIAKKSGEIVLADDGVGMTLDVFRSAWMRIATTDATVRPRSGIYGRPRTGAKGVGRFACRRLASKLSLESIAKTSSGYERVTAFIDWADFKPGKDLEAIKVKVRSERLDAAPASTGVTLTLIGLRESWGLDEISDVQSELEALAGPTPRALKRRRPGGLQADPGFAIRLEIPEFPEYSGELSERFMAAAWGTLSGRVDAKGLPSYQLKPRASDVTTRFRPSGSVYQSLVGAEFEIKMMIYGGSQFRATGFNLAQARSIGREHGGVRVYLDGFQVFSYGDPTDDWLGLDQDRARRLSTTPGELSAVSEGLERPMLLLPGNMQLFGSVAVSHEMNPALAVSINRERLVDNEASQGLKKFVRDGINWMTIRYARDTAKYRASRRPSTGAPAASLTAALQVVRDGLVNAVGLSQGSRNALEAALQQLEAVALQEQEERISELSMLRVLASAGTTVVLFDHMLRAMAAQLAELSKQLSTAAGHLPPHLVDPYELALTDLKDWSTIAVGQGALVGLIVGPDARKRQSRFVVHPLVESLKRGFFGYTSRFGISLENHVPKEVRSAPVYKAELYAVLLNFITNALKAVRESKGDRRISVEASVTSEATFVVRVSDTGIGLDPARWEEVFEPFETTSDPDPVLGEGTGLGLKIVKDVASLWGGNARFVRAKRPWKTVIELQAPIRRVD